VTSTVTHDPSQTIAVHDVVEQGSLTTPSEKVVRIGGKIVRLSRCVIFQMAKAAIPLELFADILRRVDRLKKKSVHV